MRRKKSGGGYRDGKIPPPLQLVIREGRNFRNYNSNEHSTNKWHAMGRQTRQKRNGGSNCKSTGKLCGPFFRRSRVSDGELLVQMLRATLWVSFTALYWSYQRVFNERATKKERKKERSGIAWLTRTEQRRTWKRRTTRTGITREARN